MSAPSMTADMSAASLTADMSADEVLSKRLTPLSNRLERIEDYLDKCAEKLFFLERRSMEANYLMHELTRTLMGKLSDFRVKSDSSWLTRSVRDVIIGGVRTIVKIYPSVTFEQALGAMKVCTELAVLRIGEGERGRRGWG